jgi:hypothetical protein
MNNEYIGHEAALKASQMTKLGTDMSGWDIYLRDDQSGVDFTCYRRHISASSERTFVTVDNCPPTPVDPKPN